MAGYGTLEFESWQKHAERWRFEGPVEAIFYAEEAQWVAFTLPDVFGVFLVSTKSEHFVQLRQIG